MDRRLRLAKGFAKSVVRPSWPSYAVLFVTSRCNARCVFCFNWTNVFQKQQTDEITLDEFERLAESMNPLLHLVLSGGEPFLRPDVAEIITAFHRKAGTELVGIPTNAYLPDQVEKATRQVLTECPELALNLNLSIDGIDEKHDEVRGVKNQFPKILETYRRLHALREKHPNLTINAQTVIAKHNIEDVEETIRYLRENLELDFHGLAPVRGSTPEKDAKEITSDQVRAVFATADRSARVSGNLPLERIAESFFQRIREASLRAMDSDRREFTCRAGRKMVVVSHDGKVYPCEPLWLDEEMMRVFPGDALMGDLRETDFDIRPILESDDTKRIGRDIDAEHCACMYGCAIYNGLLFAPSTYPESVRRALFAARGDG